MRCFERAATPYIHQHTRPFERAPLNAVGTSAPAGLLRRRRACGAMSCAHPHTRNSIAANMANPACSRHTLRSWTARSHNHEQDARHTHAAEAKSSTLDVLQAPQTKGMPSICSTMQAKQISQASTLALPIESPAIASARKCSTRSPLMRLRWREGRGKRQARQTCHPASAWRRSCQHSRARLSPRIPRHPDAALVRART